MLFRQGNQTNFSIFLKGLLWPWVWKRSKWELCFLIELLRNGDEIFGHSLWEVAQCVIYMAIALPYKRFSQWCIGSSECDPLLKRVKAWTGLRIVSSIAFEVDVLNASTDQEDKDQPSCYTLLRNNNFNLLLTNTKRVILPKLQPLGE